MGNQFSLTLSGNTLVFNQNPSDYTILPKAQKYGVLQTLNGNNIYQYPYQDNEVRIMTWDLGNTILYSGLIPFVSRDINGNIPISYLTDGTVNEFVNTPIQILDVYAQPVAGLSGYYKISLQFKPAGFIS